MATTRYVLVQDEWGIYLGSFLGLGFWSLLDPAGQPDTCTFPSAEAALAFTRTWDSAPRGIRAAAVTVDREPSSPEGPVYATIAECVAAGLPGWDSDAVPDETRLFGEGVPS